MRHRWQIASAQFVQYLGDSTVKPRNVATICPLKAFVPGGRMSLTRYGLGAAKLTALGKIDNVN
jgi:hypothetical protein